MKVLSIRQPWAWFILHAYKDIENRTWKTNFSGKFLIHASKTFDNEAYKWIKSQKIPTYIPTKDDCLRGGIVGQSEIVDCVIDSYSPWFCGPYGFRLQNSRKLPFMECTGQLGFFEEPTCRVCGCTSYNACVEGCSWVKPDLCSCCDEANPIIERKKKNV